MFLVNIGHWHCIIDSSSSWKSTSNSHKNITQKTPQLILAASIALQALPSNSWKYPSMHVSIELSQKTILSQKDRGVKSASPLQRRLFGIISDHKMIVMARHFWHHLGHFRTRFCLKKIGGVKSASPLYFLSQTMIRFAKVPMPGSKMMKINGFRLFSKIKFNVLLDI